MAVIGLVGGVGGLVAHPSPLHPSQPRVMQHSLVLRGDSGDTLSLDASRWHARATPEERALLADVEGPVIDLGCGPGRVLVELARRGVCALGVDCSGPAVALARRSGAAVVRRDVFRRLPGEGRWATALLFDGTVAIGGDPVRLLTRCRELLVRQGRLIAEVEPPGTGWRPFTAWLERDGRPLGAAFPWGRLGADAVTELAAAGGFVVGELTELPSGRWFAHMTASTR